MAEQGLLAKYVSNSESKTFHESLLPLSVGHTSIEKSAYLEDLRNKVGKLQDDINAFLTAKMEEDKHEDMAGSSKIITGVDEKKEEDFYGEEDVEDDS